MAETERVICASAALAEGGDGVRFEVVRAGETVPAFVVRYGGAPRAYLNRCAHVPMELDWSPGKFFDLSRTLLVCSTHGAIYDPTSGRCVGGPCRGARLIALPVMERDGAILLRAES
jgi:nitrite reductase/ring-hydroxylating ferredoxin subunit